MPKSIANGNVRIHDPAFAWVKTKMLLDPMN